MRVLNIDCWNYLFSFNFTSLKYLYYFIKDSFYNCFLTKEGFLYSKQVGWNFNFLNIFNFLKTIVIFIWEQLTKYIPFLEVFNWLYDFLKTCLDYLKGMIEDLKKFFKSIPSVLKSDTLLISATVAAGSFSIIQGAGIILGGIGGGIAGGPGGAVAGADLGDRISKKISDSCQSIAEVAKTSALYVIKVIFMVFNFIFKIMLIIGKSLITIVLKFLDIFYVFLKIWYRFIRIFLFIIKAFIIIITLIAFLVCDETMEDPLINSIRKELYKKK